MVTTIVTASGAYWAIASAADLITGPLTFKQRGAVHAGRARPAGGDHDGVARADEIERRAAARPSGGAGHARCVLDVEGDRLRDTGHDVDQADLVGDPGQRRQMRGGGTDATGADEAQAREPRGGEAARSLGRDPARAPAVKDAADRAPGIGPHRRRSLERPADDLQAEPLDRVERLRRDDVLVGDDQLALAAAERVANVLLADDVHSRPSSAVSVALAPSMARRTSASEPEMNILPKRPTVRTSTILIVAIFSASFAAAAM